MARTAQDNATHYYRARTWDPNVLPIHIGSPSLQSLVHQLLHVSFFSVLLCTKLAISVPMPQASTGGGYSAANILESTGRVC